MSDVLFWSLDDYERFVQHEDYFARNWAVHRIQNQYPERAAEAFAGLLTDHDESHVSVAAQTLGRSGDPSYEPALLAALPDSTGNARHWITVALGQLRSETLLPQLIRKLDAAGATPSQGPGDPRSAPVTALGYYPNAEARAALWRFVKSYRQDDHLADAAFSAILRFPEADDVPRLIQRYRQLTPTRGWHSVISAFADAVGLRRLAEELTRAIDYRPRAAWGTMEMWLDQPVVSSATFEEAFEAAVAERFSRLLPHIAAEIRHVAAEQEDDLGSWRAAWIAGDVPTGYRWRMTYSSLLASALAERPSRRKERYLTEVGLCLALLGQVLTDYDDEWALEAAADAEARRAALVEILGSPRQNVMPDVVEEVAALGTAVVPDLIDVLRDKNFWAWERALTALEQVGRAHPGAADDAVPAILDLIYEDQGDYVLEAAADAIQAIGPAAVELAAARLGLDDDAYDIYITGALSEVPTEASVDALLAYIDDVGALEEWIIESLTVLGHRRAIPILQSIYQPGDPLVARALYTVGLLNGYSGPEMAQWRTVAQREYERVEGILDSLGGEAEKPAPAPKSDAERSQRSRRRRRRRKTEPGKSKKKAKTRRRRRRRR